MIYDSKLADRDTPTAYHQVREGSHLVRPLGLVIPPVRWSGKADRDRVNSLGNSGEGKKDHSGLHLTNREILI